VTTTAVTGAVTGTPEDALVTGVMAVSV